MKENLNEIKSTQGEKLKGNIRSFKIFLLIILILNILFGIFSLIYLKANSEILIRLLLYLILTVLVFWRFKEIDIKKTKRLKNSFLIIALILLSIQIYLITLGTFPGIFFLFTFYAFQLRRSVSRYEKEIFIKKFFIDKFLSFLEVLTIIIFVLGSIFSFIYQKVVTENIRQDAVQEYMDYYMQESDKE